MSKSKKLWGIAVHGLPKAQMELLLWLLVIATLALSLFIVGFLQESQLVGGILGTIFFVLLLGRQPRLHVIGIWFMLVFYNEFPDNAQMRVGLFYRFIPAPLIDTYLLLAYFRSFLYQHHDQPTQTLRRTVFYGTGVLALAWGAFQLINGFFHSAPLNQMLTEARPFVFAAVLFLFLKRAIHTKQDFRFLLAVLLLFTGVRSIVGIYRHAAGTGASMTSVGAIPMIFVGHDNNFFVLFLLIACFLFLSLPWDRIQPKWMLVFVPSVVFSLFYSFRRGVLLALLATSFVMAIGIFVTKTAPRKLLLKRIMVLLVVLLGVAVGSNFVQNVYEHLSTATSVGENLKAGKQDAYEMSNLIRIWEVANALIELRDHWLLGLGFGTEWGIHIDPVLFNPPTRNRLHNTYLCVWIKYGIIGLFLFLMFFVKAFQKGLVALKTKETPLQDKMPAVVAIAYLFYFALVSNIGDMPYYIRSISLVSLAMYTIACYPNLPEQDSPLV